MEDKVIAFSKYGKDIFRRFFNMDVPYIYHGIDTNLFDRQKVDRPSNMQKKFIVGDIHRNQPRKQPIRLIEAFAKFAKGKDDVLLHLQKDWWDPFGWPLDYFVRLYGIQNKIINPLPVGIPFSEVARLYNLWDVNMSLTAGEGFNIPLIEGFGAGTPSIATDYTTHFELIAEGSPSPRGILVPPATLYWDKLDVAATQRALADIDLTVNALETYYYDRDLLAQHGENAYQWVRKHCAWKDLQYKWKKEVKEVLNG